MPSRVRFKSQSPIDLCLQIDEKLLILSPQTIQNSRMYAHIYVQSSLLLSVFPCDSRQLTLDINAHAQRGFDIAPSMTIRAVHIHRRQYAFLNPLPGHLHEAKIGNRQHIGPGPIPAQGNLHRPENCVLVLSRAHIDEVKYH